MTPASFIILIIIVALVAFILGWICPPLRTPREIEEDDLQRRLMQPGTPRAVAEPMIKPAKKVFSILVNGVVLDHVGEEISYGQVLELAGVRPKTRRNGDYDLSRSGHKQFPVRSVTYWVWRPSGSDSERSGIMHPGGINVLVETGMVFNVANTSGA